MTVSSPRQHPPRSSRCARRASPGGVAMSIALIPNLRAEGGNASHAARAAGSASSAAAKSSGSRRASALSSTVHEPFAFATSTARIPASAMSPRSSSRISRALFVAAHPLDGRRGANQRPLVRLVERAHRPVDPAEAQRVQDRVLVLDDLDPRPAPRADEPGAGRGAMVLLEPGAPGRRHPARGPSRRRRERPSEDVRALRPRSARPRAGRRPSRAPRRDGTGSARSRRHR